MVDELYKVAAINLCSNMPGQVALGIMVNPPKPGEPSYPLFIKEKGALIDSLRRRARLITDAFNGLDGVVCQETDGAMYSFPKITLPEAFMEMAKSKGKAADVLYCLMLLEETGLSCVPGSGFQQRPVTFHMRTTILPQEKDFPDIINRFVTFHSNLMRKYGGSGMRSRL